MDRHIRARVRFTAAAVAAAALTIGPVTFSFAGTHPTFTPQQATAPTASCSIVRVPVPDGWQGGVVDINDAGVLVGSSQDPAGTLHPTFWTPDGAAIDGGYTRHAPAVPTSGEFLDVNNAGVAVGFDGDAGQGFVFDTVTGAFRFLPDMAGGQADRPRRINAAGVISGAASDPNGTWIATTWSPPYNSPHPVGVPWEQQAMTWTDPSTGQVYNWIAGSDASGINDAGTVAVFTAVIDPHIMRAHGLSRFSRYPGDNQPVNSSTAPAVPMTKTAAGQVDIRHTTGDQAYAFDLNDSGIVVGDDVTNLDTYDTRPVYWLGSAEKDLGIPADAQGGRALNIDGTWITGYLYYSDGTSRAYVWTGTGLLATMPNLSGYPGGTSAHGVDQKLREVAGLAYAADGENVPVVWRCPADFTTAG
jgi:hypothetical protein